MNAARPIQTASGGMRAALIFAAAGWCCYALGFLLGHQSTKTFGTREAAVLHSQTDPAFKRTAPDSLSVPGDSSQAVVSPFFLGLTNAFQAFEAKARQLDGSGRAKQELPLLTPLMRLLSTNDYPKLWTLLEGLRTGELRDELQKRLLESWSRLDPHAALKAVQSPPNVEPKDWEINTVLSGWAEKEPDAALAWVKKTLPVDQQNGALLSIIEGLSNQNPKAAAEWLAGLPGSRDKWVAAMGLLDRLAPLDPNAALALLDQTGLSDYRDQGFAFIAEVSAAASIPDALSWVQTLSSDKDKQAALRAVVSRLASTQPEQATQFLLSQPDSKQRDELGGTLAETWARQDPQSAAGWVSQLPDGRLRQEAAAGLERSWAPQDPEATANFIMNSLPPGEARTSLLRDVAQTWTWARSSSPAAMAWAGQLPAGTDHDAFVAGISQGLAPGDPSQAAPLAASIAPGELQSEAFRMVARFWVFHYGNAPDAAAWSATLSPGPTRAAAMAAITRDWALLDPMASGAWLESLPANDARAKAAEAYVDQTAWCRPDLAAQWVGSIADEATRNDQIENIARAWLKQNPAAAQAWLQQTSLPDERKKQFLAK